ncbi:pollen-specific leucine-rich repeat extensin-like protein 1 isoform X2 [Megalops cyprinoides]|uniref:pollen-specific leucine-rich repeat extensin-like protein 1 isoform X2 n=1 Tax=Megalops cyprinoides TaxID=118141 RepID=UPI0018652463|nr:pollen-specific leucine-rich repeat extensin-like protein 1 isoform X2 [Megalops cyprinoides]
METLEKDTTQSEYKQPDENEGGILRRLRDRDLLRKRRAEAEEKAIYQVQSKRKRERREVKSGSGRKGRPRKSEAGVVPQPSQDQPPQEVPCVEEALSQGLTPSQAQEQPDQDASKADEPLIAGITKAEEPPSTDTTKAGKELFDDVTKGKEEVLPLATSESQPSLPPILSLAPPAPKPQPELAPAPPQEETPAQTELKSSLSVEEPTIKDLGPDEKEIDPVPPEKLATEQGASGGPGDSVTDSAQVFSVPTIVSPPQQSCVPEPFL